jgi:hypothetical protein
MSRRATMATRSKPSAAALYKPECEIAELVLGAGARNWSAISVVWEREGLPRIDPMTGMRFWPAVESFLLRRHGLLESAIPNQPDGTETW